MLKNLRTLNLKISTFFSQVAGFSIVGIIVSAISIGLLYLFLEILRFNVYFSYTTSYFLSIGISYLLNGNLVFRSVINYKTYILYFVIYLSSMGLGLIIIVFVRYTFDFGDFINALCAAPVTMIWNFLFIRYIFITYAGVHPK